MNSNLVAAVMLLTNQLDVSPTGGRELLCKLNHDLLADIYDDRLMVLEITKQPIRGFRAVINAFKGHIDGVNNETINEVFQGIIAKDINKLFVDGSNFGEIVLQVKKKFPQVQIYTFFHNVEVRFFWGSFKQANSFQALAVLVANYLVERKSVKFSDKIICLSQRDSQLLRKVYGRHATNVSPMALRDQLTLNALEVTGASKQKFALFVGGIFYANRAGISWFVKHVAPRINIKICIVGKGFERYKKELEIEGKVDVIGAVDSLAEWYLKAHFVIAPIFDGSGMKTKVAEALMFGKKVIGTPEAFSGYEEISDKVGRVCRTADDFIVASNALDEIYIAPHDEELRSIYESKYSFTAARLRLAVILNETSNKICAGI
jgi:glycosyltransferase involved in cell wall biosynthesis